MKLIEVKSNRGHETFEYKEEQKENIIEITLKIQLDTRWKSIKNYIENCQGKKCLATKAIKTINDNLKIKHE